MNKPGALIDIRQNMLLFSAALLVVVYQFLHPGFYHKFVQDAVYTPKYIMQFVESFRQGIIYPRWMSECFWGYGSPVFVFYSPLLYFFSSGLALAGLGLASSITLLKLLCLYVGGLYMFLLLRERHGERAAMIAALFYMLLPTRLVDLYYINTPAGRFAEAWMPAVLYYSGKLVAEPFSRGNLVKTSLSYSGLMLSHIASAFIFTPFVVVFSLFTGERRNNLQTILRMSLALLSGIFISGLFFIPVLFERGEVQLEYLGKSLPFMKEFIFNFTANEIDFGAEPLWRIVRNSLTLETAILVFLFLLARRGKGIHLGREARLFLIFIAVCLFMMSSLSAFLWKFIPGMTDVALPFRFDTIYLVFMSAFLGFLMDLIRKPLPRPYSLFLAVAAVVLTMASYDALIVHKTATPVLDIGDWTSADKHEMLEYLPRAVDQKALFMLKKGDLPLSSCDDFTYRIVKWGNEDRAFAVDAPRGARLRVKTFYFPGWRAWVDGKGVPLMAQYKTGAILMDVPPGRHEVTLKFTDTLPRKAGKIISLFTLIALVLPLRKPHFLLLKKEGSSPLTEGSFRG